MGGIEFSSPLWFGLLAVVAAVAAGYGLAQWRRRRYIVRFTNLQLLEQVIPRVPGRRRRHVPAALLGVATVLLVVALAGPTAEAQVPRERATVVLVLDVSLSMSATDVTPSRIGALQVAATDFVQDLPPGINLGLVTFAGTAAVLVTPEVARDPVLRQIAALRVAESTATGEALALALNVVEDFNQRIPGGGLGLPPARVVLLSDGARNAGRDEREVALDAGARGIPITTLAFGTPYGTVQINGETVMVPPDEAAMRDVAGLSGGDFYRAATADALSSVYTTLGQQIGYETVRQDAHTPWLAAGVLGVLAAAGTGLVLTQRLPA